MTSDSLIVALLTATALLLAVGWIAVIISILLTVRRVHSVLRAVEATAESVRSAAFGERTRRPLWQAASTLWKIYHASSTKRRGKK